MGDLCVPKCEWRNLVSAGLAEGEELGSKRSLNLWTANLPERQPTGYLKAHESFRFREARMFPYLGRGDRLTSEIEVLSCHLAGLISRQTNFANVGPHIVDRACRRDADVSLKRRTAIAVTPHSSLIVIDVSTRDSPKIGVTF